MWWCRWLRCGTRGEASRHDGQCHENSDCGMGAEMAACGADNASLIDFWSAGGGPWHEQYAWATTCFAWIAMS